MAQLDRVIRVFKLSRQLNQYAETLPHTYETLRVWANTRSAGTSQEALEAGIVYTQQYKSFTVRWREEYLTLADGRLYIADDYNRIFYITTVDELESVAQRRRFSVLAGYWALQAPDVSPPFPDAIYGSRRP